MSALPLELVHAGGDRGPKHAAAPEIQGRDNRLTETTRLPGRPPSGDPQKAEPQSRVILDPSQPPCTVHLYRQTHNIPGIDPLTTAAVGDYQGAILRKLLKDNPAHVFDETYQFNTSEVFGSPDNPARLQLRERLIQEVFPGGVVPDKLTPFQQRVVAEVGAVTLYALLNPKAIVHPPWSREEMEDFAGKLKSAAPRSSEEKALVNEHREQLLMKHVMQFQSAHPEIKDIAVVFGKNHDFSERDFPAGTSQPRIIGYDWPGMDKDFPGDIFEALSRASSSAKRMEILDSCSAVPEKAFCCLTTQQEQLSALPKLSIDCRDYRDAHELLDYLARNAATPAVEAELKRMHDACSGPFAAFYPKADGNIHETGSLNARAAGRRIVREVDIATQAELVRRAASIPADAFPRILSHQAKLEALSKLDTSALVHQDGTPLTRQEMKAFLYSVFPHPFHARIFSQRQTEDLITLRNEIRSRYEKNEPPFAGLPSGPEIKESMSDGENFGGAKTRAPAHVAPPAPQPRR